MLAIRYPLTSSILLLAFGWPSSAFGLQHETAHVPREQGALAAGKLEDAWDRLESVRDALAHYELVRDPALVCVPLGEWARPGARVEISRGAEVELVPLDATRGAGAIARLDLPALGCACLRGPSGCRIEASLILPDEARKLEAGLEVGSLRRVDAWIQDLDRVSAVLATSSTPGEERRAAALACALSDLSTATDWMRSWAFRAPASSSAPASASAILTRSLGNFYAAMAGPGGPTCPPSQPLYFNELFVDQTGADADEFIELNGEAGFPLSGVVVAVVDGNGPSAGVLQSVFDMSGFFIGSTEYFVLGDVAVSLVDMVIGVQDTLLNGTATFYVLQESTPGQLQSLVGSNVRTGSSTTLVPLFGTVLDTIGLRDGGAGDVVFDAAVGLGPSHTGAPAGVWRCSDFPGSWSSRWLDEEGARNLLQERTPGETNVDCVFESGVSSCFGDGMLIACPCGNQSALGANEGCTNSTGAGGRLRATGEPSLAADSLRLLGSRMPATSTALYFQGTALLNGSAGIQFGDGLRCAGGPLVRLDPEFNSGGASTYPGAGDPPVSVKGLVTAPSTRVYQVWHRDAAPFCTAATFNLTNALHVTWFP